MNKEITIENCGLQIINTRHTNKDGIIYYTKGVATQLYEVITRSKYGVYSDLYAVIDHPIREAFIILDIHGVKDGESFYDRALSIPKILIKLLSNEQV